MFLAKYLYLNIFLHCGEKLICVRIMPLAVKLKSKFHKHLKFTHRNRRLHDYEMRSTKNKTPFVECLPKISFCFADYITIQYEQV